MSRRTTPKIAPSADDSTFLVTWTTRGPPAADDRGDSIQARLVVVAQPVFADGFASADTTGRPGSLPT